MGMAGLRRKSVLPEHAQFRPNPANGMKILGRSGQAVSSEAFERCGWRTAVYPQSAASQSVGNARVYVPAEMVAGRAARCPTIVRHTISEIVAMEAVTAIIPGLGAGTKQRRHHCRGRNHTDKIAYHLQVPLYNSDATCAIICLVMVWHLAVQAKTAIALRLQVRRYDRCLVVIGGILSRRKIAGSVAALRFIVAETPPGSRLATPVGATREAQERPWNHAKDNGAESMTILASAAHLPIYAATSKPMAAVSLR